ncbi:hypothetical protein PRUPE_5G078000 [Prunus persica]|uniref:Uncharacterized protein n=1 Tax=Prunus persica TaxID=3760 RepID=A0A251P587_PRUPE|nr:hypothetical protein PRUPE_5G078000 [Prunus persica]
MSLVISDTTFRNSSPSPALSSPSSAAMQPPHIMLEMTLSDVRKICSPTFTGDPALPYKYPTVFRTWFWRINWKESSAAPPSIFRMETFLSIRHSGPCGVHTTSAPRKRRSGPLRGRHGF